MLFIPILNYQPGGVRATVMSSTKNLLVDLILYPPKTPKTGTFKGKYSLSLGQSMPENLCLGWSQVVCEGKKGSKFQCFCAGFWRLWIFSFYSEFTKVEPPPALFCAIKILVHCYSSSALSTAHSAFYGAWMSLFGQNNSFFLRSTFTSKIFTSKTSEDIPALLTI